MKHKTIFGMLVLVLVSLFPLLPWYFLSPVRDLPFNYENLTHSLGQIAALVGMTMFAITFVLSTRIRLIEKMLGGLDKVYIIHRIFGGTAFMLLLFHPILLVLKFIPQSPDLAALYLIPGHGFSVDMGIIALSGLIILLCLTFYINIKYSYWKMSHKFLGLFFIFAVFHIFLVRGEASRDYIFRGYYIYAIIVSSIGLLAFIYSLLFKSINSVPYRISSIKEKKPYYDIELEPIKKPLKYKAGQFAFFSFRNKKLSREFHPFSFASSPGRKNIRIIIKSLGDFTDNLHHLKEGEVVSVDGPYGGFTVKSGYDDMLWIGAGIGITPFIGMAEDMIKKGYSYKVSLYYCASTKEDFVALDELSFAEKNPNFKFIPWCTGTDGRISLKNIDSISKKTKVYICGPVGFKESMIKQFIDYGISKENIYEEDFALR